MDLSIPAGYKTSHREATFLIRCYFALKLIIIFKRILIYTRPLIDLVIKFSLRRGKYGKEGNVTLWIFA